MTAYQFQEHNSVPQYQQDLQASYNSLFANWPIAMLGGEMTPPQVAQNLHILSTKTPRKSA